MPRHGCQPKLPLSLLAAAILVAGCGSEEGPAAPGAERVAETADELPKLPRGYSPLSNDSAGITMGRPPGWVLAGMEGLTVVRAPDELVSMSVTADRTSEAIAAEPGEFAAETASLLPGYREDLKPSKPRPFRHPYEAFEVTAKGISKAGVPQGVRVIALRREGIAMVTVIIAENTEVGAPDEVKQALETVRTLRTMPPR